MLVITVSRLTGSGGAAIGQRLAERLGASYLNTQIIREVAHRLGISEAAATQHDERAEASLSAWRGCSAWLSPRLDRSAVRLPHSLLRRPLRPLWR
jgi:hypothetical protein